MSPPGTSEQYGAVARVAGKSISGKDYSVHIGADAEWLIQPPRNLIANTQTLTLSDRPELRIDPDDADLDRCDCKCVGRAGL